MKRKVPVIFIKILKNWYDRISICVKWNGNLSRNFQVTAGVRRGGVLSPALFLIYINDMLFKLSKCGCTIALQSVGALMYADDLIMLSPAVQSLQDMLLICESELALLDLKINASKSTCLRIGVRYSKLCFVLHSQSGPIPWVAEAKFLGISILAGKKFSCNFARKS